MTSPHPVRRPLDRCFERRLPRRVRKLRDGHDPDARTGEDARPARRRLGENVPSRWQAGPEESPCGKGETAIPPRELRVSGSCGSSCFGAPSNEGAAGTASDAASRACRRRVRKRHAGTMRSADGISIAIAQHAGSGGGGVEISDPSIRMPRSRAYRRKNAFHCQCAVASLYMLTLDDFDDKGGATGDGTRHAELGEDARVASAPKRSP